MSIGLNILNSEKNHYGFYQQISEQDFILENIIKYSSDFIVILNNKKQIISYSEQFKSLFKNTDINGENFLHIMNKISTLPQDFFNEKQYFIKVNTGNFIKIFQANICKYNGNSLHDNKYIIIFNNIAENNEAKSDRNLFINTIMHDLKTPIRANSLALDLLLNKKYGKLLPKQIEIIKEIFNSNKLIFSMLDTLLAKFQCEDNNFKLSKSLVNLNQLISKIIENSQVLLQEKNIKIKIDFPNQNIFLYADELKLKRAIASVINNSIKFNKMNGIVEINAKTEEENIIINIKDTGMGITKEKINNIFDKCDKITCFRKIGTGLSLYLTKKIIEKHNGNINVTSIPKKFSCFTISLPIMQ